MPYPIRILLARMDSQIASVMLVSMKDASTRSSAGQKIRRTTNTDKAGAAAAATNSKATALAPLQQNHDHQSNGDEQMYNKQDSAQMNTPCMGRTA